MYKRFMLLCTRNDFKLWAFPTDLWKVCFFKKKIVKNFQC